MIECKEIRIPTQGVRSLAWDGDTLVDWVAGGQRYLLNGEIIPRSRSYAFPVDAAVVSPSGRYSVVYSGGGTKGLILCDGDDVREINRSDYQSRATYYPVALARLKSGREVIIHCPDEYCTLEIEDLETGARLTPPAGRVPCDFFHARLDASPDGTLLISAGWVWHPIGLIRVFDLDAALVNPSELDGSGFGIDVCEDESSAVFLPERRIAMALINHAYTTDDASVRRSDAVIRVFDLRTPTVWTDVEVNERIWLLMAVGHNHVLCFNQHPILIDLQTGAVIRRWPRLDGGTNAHSPIPYDCDCVRQRCAFADSDGITVLDFSGTASIE